MASVSLSEPSDFMFRCRNDEEREKIVKEMRCAKCKIVPYPFVRHCGQGHLFCPVCATKTTNCPRENRATGEICGKEIGQGDLQSTVYNMILLFHYNSAKDRNHAGGGYGREEVSRALVVTEGDQCPFSDCVESIPPDDLIMHLNGQHGKEVIEGDEIKMEMAWTPFTSRVEAILHFFGQVFAIVVKEADSNVLLWVVKLHGDRDCKCFTAKILLQATNDEQQMPQQMKLCWEGVPVSTIHSSADDGFQIPRDYLIRKFSRYLSAEDSSSRTSFVCIQIKETEEIPAPVVVPRPASMEVPSNSTGQDAAKKRRENGLEETQRNYYIENFRNPNHPQFVLCNPQHVRGKSHTSKNDVDFQRRLPQRVQVRHSEVEEHKVPTNSKVVTDETARIQDKVYAIKTELKRKNLNHDNNCIQPDRGSQGVCHEDLRSDSGDTTASSLEQTHNVEQPLTLHIVEKPGIDLETCPISAAMSKLSISDTESEAEAKSEPDESTTDTDTNSSILHDPPSINDYKGMEKKSSSQVDQRTSEFQENSTTGACEIVAASSEINKTTISSTGSTSSETSTSPPSRAALSSHSMTQGLSDEDDSSNDSDDAILRFLDPLRLNGSGFQSKQYCSGLI